MLTEVIREMMQQQQVKIHKHGEDLWLSYHNLHGLHRLTVVRQDQWPTLAERDEVERSIQAASAGDVALKWKPVYREGKISKSKYNGYQCTWTAQVSAHVEKGVMG